MSFNDKFLKYAEKCGFDPSPYLKEHSITLSIAEWIELNRVINTGLLNMNREELKKHYEEYRDLFDKLEKQF
jgi:hypothetical protein